MSKISKRRRKIRQRQRHNRQKLNQRLKDDGKGWLARRKIIRTNRKADRNARKSTIKDMKAKQAREALAKNHRAQGRKGRRSGRNAASVPMPVPPPPSAHNGLVNVPRGAGSGGGGLMSSIRPGRFPGPRRPMPRRRPQAPAWSAPRLPGPAAQALAPMDPWAMSTPHTMPAPMPPMDPWGMAQPPMPMPMPMPMPPIAPWAFDPDMDPQAAFYDQTYAPLQFDPLHAYDAWNPNMVDPYDDAIIVDVDSVDFLPPDDFGLWEEYRNDVSELAGELAADLAGVAVSGEIGADTEVRDLEGLIEQLGQAKLRGLKVIAEYDLWNPTAYERDARVVVDAVNELQDALAEAAESPVSGVEVGAAGLTAALAAIPGVAALLPKLVDARQKADARQDGRRRNRRNRRAERERNHDRELAELEAVVDKHRAGTLNLDEGDGGEWGGKARAGDIIVRAKLGKRAALASMGNGLYLVREVPEGVSTAAIQSEMTELVANFQAANSSVSGVAGCQCKRPHAAY